LGLIILVSVVFISVESAEGSFRGADFGGSGRGVSAGFCCGFGELIVLALCTSS